MDMLVNSLNTNSSSIKPLNPALPKAVSIVSTPPQAISQSDLVQRNPVENVVTSNLFKEPEKNDLATQFANSIFGRTVTDYSSLARKIVTQQISQPKTEKTKSEKSSLFQDSGKSQTNFITSLNQGDDQAQSSLMSQSLGGSRTLNMEQARTAYASQEQRTGITSYQRYEAASTNTNNPALFQMFV
ncbi:MAG: hypothetical protein WCI88_04440 [Chloroflexota bacterium]|jgi:hypothetical protein